MKRTALCLLVFPLFCFADGEMFTKRYLLDAMPDFGRIRHMINVQGTFGGDPFGAFGPERQAPPRKDEPRLPWARISQGSEELQDHLADHLGMEFPEGSWVRFQAVPLSLTLHNTRANHDLLMLGLMQINAFARQVQIDVRMVSFASGELDAMERESGRPLSDAKIFAMWRGGQGKTLFAQGVKTVNGVNTIIEHVDERIYPTEMWSKEVKTITPEGESVTHPPYGGFETRQMGFILNVTPSVSPAGNTINLTLLPEHAQDHGNDPDAPEKLRPLLPRFRSMNLTTSLVIHNGQTVVAGNSSSLDREQRIYLFLTATLVDAGGNPIQVSADGEE